MLSSTEHNVGGWPALHAARAGDRIAVVDDERELDYRALERRCQHATGWLAEAGVGRGDRVALWLANRSAYLELVFACARLGAMAVPLNTRLAPPELAELLSDCTPRLLIQEAELEAPSRTARAGLARAPAVLQVGGEHDAYEAALAASRADPTVQAVSPEDPMILMYTSGTTGLPKGALLPHRKTLYNSLNAERFFQLGAADRVLVVVPLFHSFGLKILSLPALCAGARVVLQRHFDPLRVWQCVGEQGLTILGGVPTMFRALFDVLAESPDGRFALDSLRFLFTAGSAIPVELIRAFEARGLVLKQGFGQTETSVLCCLEAGDALRKAGSVGRPVQHAELRIVHSDDLEGPVADWRDVTTGETGEIVVRGPITMLGYWRRPEATAETLREGWLRTGDLASADTEGFVTLRGRARDLYISGGENVYPAQIEAVFREHPAIQEIAVVGIPDARWGEVGEAHVVLAEGARLEPEALQAWGRERLARFKIPKRFVAVAMLPRTVTGKVQKFRLRTR